jgi:translation initiation factor 5B
MIRSPVCTVVGHVDHGKSSILDAIRGSSIVLSEPGRITQAIGASIVPIETIKKICGDMIKNITFTIPGLLFIDTPGHAAFTNLRKRGGSLADIAIVVIDINEGFKPQTLESIEILKQYKTPFIIALNKIDLIPGWQTNKGSILASISMQAESVRNELDKRIYESVGKLFELGFQSERFDRVENYTKQIAFVPVSAITKEGLPELLMVVSGLAQKYLEEGLECDAEGYAKGTILEVKEEEGLGTTIDVIIYDGNLKVGDTIIIGGIDKPIVTKVRALLEPAPLAEMRDKKAKFKPVKQVYAASGVKIAGPELENAISGMPLRSASAADLEKIKEEIQQEIDEVMIETGESGLVIKADNIGSLEALSKLLQDKQIPIRKATVGSITKKDIMDADSNTDPFQKVILGFNVNVEVENPTIKIITNNVIYKTIEDYEVWIEEEKKRIEAGKLEGLVKPCKFELMRGYVFRQQSGSLRCGHP